MSQPYESAHEELHYINRAGWLRASVLGANDGIVSVSSLIVGVAAADPSPTSIFVAGAAGLAAGAMSMAAGEYVSVSSQSDVERADIAREKQALIDTPEAEEAELASIYESRGLSVATAALVARELTAKDALAAHVGGAPKPRATARVLFWGAAAMAITAGVGSFFGVSV